MEHQYYATYILLNSSFETPSSFGSTKERISQNSVVVGGGLLYTIIPFQMILNLVIPSFSSGALHKFWVLIIEL